MSTSVGCSTAEARLAAAGCPARGQCDVVNIDLGPITVNALVANVDIPAATVDVKASGAVGVLLCDLANALSGLTSGTGALAGTAGIVNALNSLM